MKTTVTFIVLSAAFVMLHGPAALAQGSFAYEFNAAGVLPSSQGASYDGSVPESLVFSVSGGFLHQDSTQYGIDALAVYIDGSFNPLQDAGFSWGVRVNDSLSPYAVNAGLQGLGLLWDFNLANDGIWSFTTNGFIKIVNLDTTDAVHNYRVTTHGGLANYELFVDGVLRYNGVAPSGGSFSPYARWGDMAGTPGTVGAAADWDYVRLVPEPSAMILFGVGLSVAFVRFRRKDQ